jgi:emp24/gp25L/p24 family/GOLD
MYLSALENDRRLLSCSQSRNPFCLSLLTLFVILHLILYPPLHSLLPFARESATITAIVLQGDQLKAQIQFDGPVLDAAPDATTSVELKNALARIDVGHLPSDTSTYIHFVDTIDFEHLNTRDGEDEEHNADDFMYDDDDSVAALPEAEREAAKDKKRQMKERKKALEAKHRDEQKAAHQARKVRNEGEPFVRTFKTTTAGWYRYCVVASFYQVTVEADYRKESELGGLDENGDVLTYEEKQMLEEDKLMEADSANEEGIKDEDFVSTKEKLKTLRRLLAEIQGKQQQERHRLNIHSQTNEHSHSRMVLGSLLETMLFMVVTGIQVATIRRWFKGAPVLGR